MPRYGGIHCLLEHKESLVVEEFLKTTPQDAEDINTKQMLQLWSL